MKNLTRAIGLSVLLMGAATVANASIITEEYTGSQDVNEGQSFSFDFDLWFPNWLSGSNSSSSLNLTTDGVGAVGAWSGATLYIGFASTDSDPEIAAIDLDGWTFRFGTIPLFSQDVMFDQLSFNAGGSGPGSILANYYLTQAQTNELSSWGGGTLRLTATNNNRSYDNDFTITKVGLSVITAVAEPSTLALFGAGLLGVMLLARNRRRFTLRSALPA